MPQVMQKIISSLSYILSLPYFSYVAFRWISSLVDKSLGRGLWSSGFEVFFLTLPWSIPIDQLNRHMTDYKNYTSFSLMHPAMYLGILGVLYGLALLLNTGILFFIGKLIQMVVKIIFKP